MSTGFTADGVFAILYRKELHETNTALYLAIKLLKNGFRHCYGLWFTHIYQPVACMIVSHNEMI